MNTTQMIVEVAKALGENAARDPHLVDQLVAEASTVFFTEFGRDYSAAAAFVVDMYLNEAELD